MRYIIDFDRTLFDFAQFVARVEADGRRTELATPKIWQYYNVSDFFYPDVLSWFESKLREELYILTAMTPSYGPEACEYQREKLARSGLVELVSDVTFMVGEKGSHAAAIANRFPPHEPIVFIDDRIEHCLEVTAAVPRATCCLMVRDRSVIGDVSTVRGMPVVHTLKEVDAMIDV
jgi:FMN phosphatase YigB (HAD superfamily)